jgi:hypothetical protein
MNVFNKIAMELIMFSALKQYNVIIKVINKNLDEIKLGNKNIKAINQETEFRLSSNVMALINATFSCFNG